MATVREILGKINIDGLVSWDESLALHTTFKVGGPADAWVRADSVETLARVLGACREAGIRAFVLGGGANVLASDSGYRGVVLGTEGLAALAQEGDGFEAGAGARVVDLVGSSIGAGLAGLEFAAGLPGSVGGAVYMNARCYEREMADVLERVDYLEADGSVASIGIERAEWAYKRTPFMPGGALSGRIVVGARFALRPGDPEALAARARELEADRRAKGHFDWPCAGSVFKNDRRFGRPSGKILDELGFRGRRIGQAAVSEKHANIFVNLGGARAADLRALIHEAQRAAKEAYGFDLEPEIVFLGDF